MNTKRKRLLKYAAVALVSAAGYGFAIRPLIADCGGTIIGSLSSHQHDIVIDEAHKLLRSLPPLSRLSDNSLRFAAMPQLRKRWFAIALDRTQAGVIGKLTVLERSSGTLRMHSFRMSKASADQFLKRWDSKTDSYWGELGMAYDGTVVGFERKRGLLITSGIGNAPCHYDALSDLAASYIGSEVGGLPELLAPHVEKMRQTGAC